MRKYYLITYQCPGKVIGNIVVMVSNCALSNLIGLIQEKCQLPERPVITFIKDLDYLEYKMLSGTPIIEESDDGRCDNQW